MIRDPFEIYRKPAVKRVLNMLLSIGLIILIIYSLFAFAFKYEGIQLWTWFNNEGLTLIIGIVCIWIGYMLLNGKFSSDAMASGGPFQSKPTRNQPKRRPKKAPQKVQYDECAFCKEQYPITKLDKFYNKKGEYILVCGKCKNE